MTDRELLEKILEELQNVKGDVKSIKLQQNEDHQILKNLEHNSNINKAEHDNMYNKIAHIEGHLKNIDGSIEVMKDFIGHHQVDIEILKRRPV